MTIGVLLCSQESVHVRWEDLEEKSEETRPIRGHNASIRRFFDLQNW